MNIEWIYLIGKSVSLRLSTKSQLHWRSFVLISARSCIALKCIVKSVEPPQTVGIDQSAKCRFGFRELCINSLISLLKNTILFWFVENIKIIIDIYIYIYFFFIFNKLEKSNFCCILYRYGNNSNDNRCKSIWAIVLFALSIGRSKSIRKLF